MMSDETAVESVSAKSHAKLPKEVEKMLAHVARSTNTDMVFGETRTVGDHALIPVARVMYGGGGGGMSEAAADEPAGAGTGMGISVVARPVGVIKVTGDKVEWVPTVDVGMLATVGAVVAGAMAILFMIGRNKKLGAKVTHASAPPSASLMGLASEVAHLVARMRSKAAS